MIGSLRELQLFVAVYEERSFTTAAKREGATQSGASQHIQRLEDRLGTNLFLRERGRITPTPAADRFYAGCIETLRANFRATDSMQEYAKGPTGRLRVGLMPTMARTVMRHAVSDFVTMAPNVALEIVDGFSGQLNRMIQADEIDFAVVPEYPGAPGIRTRPFTSVPEVLISGRGSDLIDGQPVALRDLPPLRMIAPCRQNVRRQTLEGYFVRAEVQVDRILDMDSILGALDLIEHSNWVTIQPAMVLPFTDRQSALVINPIIGPELDLPLVLIEPARRPVSGPSRLFLELLEKYTLEIAEPWRRARMQTAPVVAR